MKDVALYLKARHAVRIEGLSERAAARRFGIDPRTVNKMMKFSVPPGYVRKKPPVKPKLDPFIPVILASSTPTQQRRDAARIAVAAGICLSEAWDVVAAAYQRRLLGGLIKSWWIAVRRIFARSMPDTDVTANDIVRFIPYRRQDVFALLRAELETSMGCAGAWDIGGRA